MESRGNTYMHPKSGEELHREVRRISFEYKGVKFSVVMPGWYPEDGDDGIFTQENLQAYDKALRLAQSEPERLGEEE